MASPKKDMLANIAGSMQGRAAIRGESAPPVPAGKSAIERQAEGRKNLAGAAVIQVNRIIPDPGQPRTEFDEDALRRLGDSIRERGQLQPVRVRWDDAADRYMIVVGERRWRAAQLAGIDTLACVVVKGEVPPDELLEDQLIENLLRDDLKPIEQARAFKSLLSARGLSQHQLAERLRVGQSTINKALALLNLPDDIQASVDAGKIGPDVAYQLTKVADPAEQADLARAAESGQLKRDEIKAQTSAGRNAAKGRGAGKGKAKIMSRVFRLGAGKVTVELGKGSGDEAIVALLREAMEKAESRLANDSAASAA
jgi:ParB family chromosome partitioning protein